MTVTDLPHASIAGAGLATEAGAGLSGPAGNTGRRYAALPLTDGMVALTVYSSAGKFLPTGGGTFTAEHATALGVALLQAGALADTTARKVDVMADAAPASGGRRFRARLGTAEGRSRPRRILLRVARDSGVPLPSAGDAFDAPAAIELGAALIAAAGHTRHAAGGAA